MGGALLGLALPVFGVPGALMPGGPASRFVIPIFPLLVLLLRAVSDAKSMPEIFFINLLIILLLKGYLPIKKNCHRFLILVLEKAVDRS